MKILFLDDDENRHRIFVKANVGHDIHQVFNAQQCITHLGQHEYDVVFLDHDLGGEESQMRMDCAEDGRTVARWIAANSRRFPNTSFVVHSLNPNGRNEMVCLIDQAGLEAYPFPFAWKHPVCEGV